MKPDLKDERQLKSLTTDELKRLWVEAFKIWAPNPDIGPLEVADVEAELDFRKEGLPFHLVREELAILATYHVASITSVRENYVAGEIDRGPSSLPNSSEPFRERNLNTATRISR
jgi:hypothetical protein